MSGKNQDLLSSFMKKQAAEKPARKAEVLKLNLGLGKSSEDKLKEGLNANQEELDEAAQLEEAKKVSKGKATQIDQTAMFKKLAFQTLAKLVMLISLLVVVFIGLIKFGPAIISFIKTIIHNVFFPF